jgi:hypothetical protein
LSFMHNPTAQPFVRVFLHRSTPVSLLDDGLSFLVPGVVGTA